MSNRGNISVAALMALFAGMQSVGYTQPEVMEHRRGRRRPRARGIRKIKPAFSMGYRGKRMSDFR